MMYDGKHQCIITFDMFQKSSPTPMNNQPMYHPSSDSVETVVGPSVMVEGDFSSEGNILVKGVVSGSVKTSRLLTVESGAKILANVRAGEAHISGSIKGNVRVDEKLELTETAQVVGDIICKTLVVAPGALVHGKIAMKGIEDPESGKESVPGSGKSKGKETTQ